MRGNRVLKARYRLNVEPKVILFEDVPEGTMFQAPLDQEFFYPSRLPAMSDASRLATSQYPLDGSFDSGGIATPKGFDGGDPPAFGGCSPAWGLRFSLSGVVQHDAHAPCAAGNRAGGGPLREISLYGEFWVALSTTSGEGPSGREPYSGSIMVRQRGEIEKI